MLGTFCLETLTLGVILNYCIDNFIPFSFCSLFPKLLSQWLDFGLLEHLLGSEILLVAWDSEKYEVLPALKGLTEGINLWQGIYDQKDLPGRNINRKTQTAQQMLSSVISFDLHKNIRSYYLHLPFA